MSGPPVDTGTLIDRCVHCGLCLESCPTFIETGREDASPRGRLVVMQGLVEERWPFHRGVQESLDGCLGCRACETACPADVPYGTILESVRAMQPRARSGLERFLVRHVLWRTGWIRSSAAVHRFLRLERWSRRVARLPGLGPWRERLLLTPELERRPRKPPVADPGPGAPPVVFLRGCVAREAFPDTERAILDLLRTAGYTVAELSRPSCCGALAAHAGESDVAARFTDRVRRAVADAGAAVVCTSAAGCGAHLAAHLDGNDVRDWTELLADPPRPLRFRGDAGTVVYQDACHLRHGLGVTGPPRELLLRAGYRVLETEEPEICCGSAGTYNLARPRLAARLGRRKWDHLRAAGAERVATANPGCLIQLRALRTADDGPVEPLALLLRRRLDA